MKDVIIHMNHVIEGLGALMNEKGEEPPLKAGDFALVNPEGLKKVIIVKSARIQTREMSRSR